MVRNKLLLSSFKLKLRGQRDQEEVLAEHCRRLTSGFFKTGTSAGVSSRGVHGALGRVIFRASYQAFTVALDALPADILLPETRSRWQGPASRCSMAGSGATACLRAQPLDHHTAIVVLLCCTLYVCIYVRMHA